MMNRENISIVLGGIAIARGIAIGPAHKVSTSRFPHKVPQYNIPGEDLNREIKRFRRACEKAKKDLQNVVERVEKEVGSHEADIIRPQIMMVEDPTLVTEVEEIIIEKNINCESAVEETIERFEKMIESLDDHYLRERNSDIRDAGRRILSQLLFVDGDFGAEIDQPVIVVAKHLLPSLTVHLEREKVLAFATEKGGYNSHAAILARSMGIPAVTGLQDICNKVVNGDEIIIDGNEGKAVLKPSEKTIKAVRKKEEQFHAEENAVIAHVGDPTDTRDGRHLSIRANIGRFADIEKALEYQAEGVGLYRTEFNYMSRNTLPDEDELVEEYADIARKFSKQGGEVCLRLLDIGGDKFPPAIPLAHEDNPFIGQRGLRLMLNHIPDLMLPQLRAIIKASRYGKVALLYPMVTSVDDLEAALDLFERAKSQLISEKFNISEKIKQGIMIEVPSCVPILEDLLDNSDFATVGTNDFVQYLLAADRNSAKMIDAYDPYEPAVMRMLGLIAEKAAGKNKPVSICGEMGGDVSLLPVFLGLGYDSLSVNVQAIPYLREAARKISVKDCKNLTHKVLKAKRSEEIKELVRKFRARQDYHEELQSVGL